MAAEERRPRPVSSFPGKLRKAEGLDKSFRTTSRLNTLAAPRHRPDRTFGTARNTNVNIQKPKPSKPNAISMKEKPKDKPKLEIKKTAVRFQDQELPAEKNFKKVPVLADGALTPKSRIRSVKPGTPYYSAKSCSNCRFDKLEYAPYWLSQIKLAESVGKHFVSASFFKLAFECNAEPARSLKSELKGYLSRHNSLTVVDVWKEISCNYGLSDGEHDLGLINFDCGIPSVEGNVDSVTKSTQNFEFGSLDETIIAPEESLCSIINENADAGDANKEIVVPCDKSWKVMVDHGNTLIKSHDYPGDVQCQKSDNCAVPFHQDLNANKEIIVPCDESSKVMVNQGNSLIVSHHILENIQCEKSDDGGVVSHQDLMEEEKTNNVKSDDSSGGMNSGSCTDTFPSDSLKGFPMSDGANISPSNCKDFPTSDEANISSIIEEGTRSKVSVYESSSSSEKSKSAVEFDGKGILKVKDEANKKKKANLDKKNFKIQNGTSKISFLVKMR